MPVLFVTVAAVRVTLFAISMYVHVVAVMW